MTRTGALTAIASLLFAAAAPESPAPESTEPAATEAVPRHVAGQSQDPPGAPTSPTSEFEPEALAAQALERGLAYLAAQQADQQDGSLPRAGGKRYTPVPNTALAALAFMGSGSSPGRGPYGREVSLAIDYLTSRADLTPGSRTLGYISFEGDELSRMHGHGFATLALTQAYAMSPRTTRGRRIEEVLRTAIRLIEKSQGLEGGWFYEPQASTEHENSVTVCLVQALRAADDSGFQVDAGVVARAIDYVRRCQDETGSFRYGLTTDKTTLALTAAGLSTLNFLGKYDGPEVERGMEVLWQRVSMRREHRRGTDSSFPYYERLYLALALWQHSDRRPFESWSADETAAVLSDQRPDGSWEDLQFGSCYATAMNCLFLSLPEGLLPIFQR